MEKTTLRLQVRDTARAAVFYEALLGAPPTEKSATSVTFDLDSPPLHLVVEATAHPRGKHGLHGRKAGAAAHHRRPDEEDGVDPDFTLTVSEPRDVGDAAVALRRAGVRLRLQDRAIAADDPDHHVWQVRFVPASTGKAIVTA